MEELIPWLYLKGVSTGDFTVALQALLGPETPGLSATTVTRLVATWQHDHETWSGRSLADKQYVYVWADGIVRHEALWNRVGCKDPPSACRSRPMKLEAA